MRGNMVSAGQGVRAAVMYEQVRKRRFFNEGRVAAHFQTESTMLLIIKTFPGDTEPIFD